jgi:hypothetical protein
MFQIIRGVASPASAATVSIDTITPALPPLGDFAAFLDRLATKPTGANLTRVQLLYRALQSVWTKLDVVAGGLRTEADSLLNWKGAGVTATNVGSVWDSTSGFTLSGSNTVDLAYVADGAVGKAYQLNSASVTFVVSTAGAATSNGLIRVVTQAGVTNDTIRAAVFNAAGPAARLNDATSSQNSANAGLARNGVWTINRPNSSTKEIWRNGVLLQSFSVASTVLPMGQLRIGEPGAYKQWLIGGALSAAEIAAVHQQLTLFNS